MYEHSLGTTPVGGAALFGGGGKSMLLREVWRKRATFGASILRIPSDPDDALRLCQMILSETHGELAAQAILAPFRYGGRDVS